MKENGVGWSEEESGESPGPESVCERRMIYKDCQCYPRQITHADSLLKEIEAMSKRMNHCEVQGELSGRSVPATDKF